MELGTEFGNLKELDKLRFLFEAGRARFKISEEHIQEVVQFAKEIDLRALNDLDYTTLAFAKVYLLLFEHVAQFEGVASVCTWISNDLDRLEKIKKGGGTTQQYAHRLLDMLGQLV